MPDIIADVITVLLPVLAAFAGWAAARLRAGGK